MTDHSFDQEGYLSAEAEEMRRIILQRFPQTFELCRDVARLAHRFRNAITLDYEEPRHLVLISLLQRAIDSLEAVVLLMAFGLEADSNAITRVTIETMLHARKLSLDKDYLQKYLGSDQVRRRKLLNITKAKPNSILGTVLRRPNIDAVISALTKEIQESDLKELSVESIAHELGLDAWYDLNYRLLSEDAHSGPRSLERYVVQNGNGVVSMFNFRPRTDRIVPVLVTQSILILIVLDSLEKVFMVGMEKDIDSLFAIVKGFRED